MNSPLTGIKLGTRQVFRLWSFALINLRNFCSDVSVPRLKLLESQAGVFPGRQFQLQP